MKDLVCAFSKLAYLVLDACAGISFRTKSCLFLHQIRTFFWCGIESKMVTAARADLMLPFVSQVLCSKCNMSRRADVKPAAKGFKIEMAALLAETRVSALDVLLNWIVRKSRPAVIFI